MENPAEMLDATNEEIDTDLPSTEEPAEDLLVEEVSIDGMCGVY